MIFYLWLSILLFLGEKMSVEQGKDRKKIKEWKDKSTKLEKEKSEMAEKFELTQKKVEALQLDLKAAERYKGALWIRPFPLWFNLSGWLISK